MSGGKVGAQCAQAAIGSWRLSDEELRRIWWEEGQHHTTITLEVADENELWNTKRYLKTRHIESFMMVDEGATEVNPHTPTVLAAEIVDKNDPHILKTFSSFQLYHDTIEAKIVIHR